MSRPFFEYRLNLKGAFSRLIDFGRRGSARLLLSGGEEALELLGPMLDKDDFGDGGRLPLFVLNHQKSLPVEGQVIGPYGVSAGPVSGFLK